MKMLCSLVCAAGALAAIAPAVDAAPTHVTGAVETAHGVFFQPSQFPTVVWFFPHTALDLTIVPPESPAGNFWRAALGFAAITADDLAQLPAAWSRKSFVPFIIRPTTECTLTRLTEMRFVTQEVRALGRDISSANPPVCRFTFRLPNPMPADVRARLDALVAGDTLILRALPIDLLVDRQLAWADAYDAVAAAITTATLTPSEARAAIGAALDSPALAAAHAAMTPGEETAFITAALAALFTTVFTNEGSALALVAAPPAGSVIYHAEAFQRAM